MKSLEWKYVKKLNNQQSVKNFLKKYNVELPKSLISSIEKNNGGRPSKKIFDTNDSKEYVFKALLSYNENDAENIYAVYPDLFVGTDLYPIGTDSSGNFICFNLKQHDYVLLNHETNNVEKIIM